MPTGPNQHMAEYMEIYDALPRRVRDAIKVCVFGYVPPSRWLQLAAEIDPVSMADAILDADRKSELARFQNPNHLMVPRDHAESIEDSNALSPVRRKYRRRAFGVA